VEGVDVLGTIVPIVADPSMASLQLNVPVPVSPAKTLAKRIGDLGTDFSQFAVKLEPTDTVAKAFPDPFATDLHVIVQLLPGMGKMIPNTTPCLLSVKMLS
jgi:hypothetical protein